MLFRSVEAMHRFTAVLTPPYIEFQALFGTSLTFGAYLLQHTPMRLSEAISAILAQPAQLAQQQQAAHQAVQHFTWSSFVDNLFTEVAALKTHPMPSSAEACNR